MKPYLLFRWGGLVVFVTAVATAVVFALYDGLNIFLYLRGLGWDQYLGSRGPNPALFAFECYSDQACRTAFISNVKDGGVGLETWLLLAVAAASLVAAALAAVLQPDPKAKDPGGSKFSTDKELAPYLTDDPKDPGNPRVGYLGCTETGKQILPRLRDRCTHVGLYAGTGGGKTTRIIKPSIVADAQAGVSVLMVDPKWPDPEGGYSDLLSVFEAHDYDIQVFCPFNDDTMHLPLIASIHNEQDAATLAALILPRGDPNEHAEGATFYRDVERRLLLYLLRGAALKKQHSVASIYRTLDGGPDALAAWADTCPDEDLARSLRSLLKLRGDTLIGLIQGLMSKLQVFTDPHLDNATQASPHAWKNLNALSLAQKTSALYVGIPNHVLLRGEGKILLSLFFRHIMNDLMMFAEDVGGSLPRHVAVYMDEFAHLGRIDDATLWFGTMRSYKIGFTVAMQNRAQLELVYGTVGAKALSGGNFQHLVTFPHSLMLDDKKYISELLGEVTVAEYTESRSRHHLFELPRKTRTRKLVSRPLVSVEEMNRWPEDIGILAPHGAGPTRIVAPRIDQRRVARVKNPFYRYGKLLGQGDSRKLVRTVLTRRRHRWLSEPLSGADRATHPKAVLEPDLQPGYTLPPEPELPPRPSQRLPSGAEVPPAPRAGLSSATPPLANAADEPLGRRSSRRPQARPARPEDALPSVPQGELIQSFRSWISDLRWKHVPVTVYTVRAEGQNRVSKVLFDRLPGALTHEHLPIWKRRKWVQVRGHTFGIVGTGTSVLCQNQLQAFMDAANAQIIDVGHDHEHVLVKERARTPTPKGQPQAGEARSAAETPSTREVQLPPDAQADLLGWYAAHRAACAFDPLHEHLRRCGAAPDIFGMIQPRCFLLPQTTVNDLLGEAAHAFSKIPLGKGPDTRNFLDVPGELAFRLEPLATWLEQNRDHLARFVSDTTQDLSPERAGYYQPTLLSVTRDVLKTLPRVPGPKQAGAETLGQRRVYEQRPRFVRYAVQDAFAKQLQRKNL